MCNSNRNYCSYLRSLYLSRNYKKILGFKYEYDDCILFYIGRVYKDLKQYNNAIKYLNNYIDRVEGLGNANIENLKKEYLISAYYHLGELYRTKKDYLKAEESFFRCMDLTDNSHIKAFQYIFELNPDAGAERLKELINRKSGIGEEYLTWVPPGHYYSPIPGIKDIKEYEDYIFNYDRNTVPGIDLNEAGQLEMFEELKQFYNEQPFKDIKQQGIRYYFKNDYYLYADAIILYSMIRFLKPRRVIEVGSGFSSAVILDTNEKFFDNKIQCMFIEPYPERLLSILKENDLQNNQLIQLRLQDLDDQVFLSLSEGDILFIDSSHVSKINSDVNYIFFNILPKLKKGVVIHFHDIFFPFEYPKEWIYEGRSWNEAYILRAFLQCNDSFKIRFFNSYFAKFHEDKLMEDMPICIKDTGASIWIEKIK